MSAPGSQQEDQHFCVRSTPLRERERERERENDNDISLMILGHLPNLIGRTTLISIYLHERERGEGGEEGGREGMRDRDR